MSAKVSLKPEEAAIVAGILNAYLPEREVWAFGSRIGSTHKQYSDLDLAVRGETPIPPDRLAALKEAFEESNLPFQVDIVDWATTGESFRKIIAERHLVFQAAPTAAGKPKGQ